MEELFEELTHNAQQIRAIRNSIDNVKVMPYYNVFAGPIERSKDMDTHLKKMKLVIDRRHTLLENLQLSINKELGYLSGLQQKNTIQRIKGCQG